MKKQNLKIEVKTIKTSDIKVNMNVSACTHFNSIKFDMERKGYDNYFWQKLSELIQKEIQENEAKKEIN